MRFLLLISCAFLLSLPAQGQSKKSLENKRKQLLKEIKITNRLLKKVAKDKNTTYDRYLALQSQIRKRQQLIITLNEEIIATEESIERTTNVVGALSYDIEERKNEYGRTLQNAFRYKKTTNPLLFILSAESLNQAFRRLLFLRRYNNFRKRQSEAINFTRKILAKKLLYLEEGKFEKEDLLVMQHGQVTSLEVEMDSKDKLLNELKSNETKLKDELQSKQKAYEKLNKEIERIIQAEIEKQRKEEARRAEEEERLRREAEAAAQYNKPRSNPSKPSRTQQNAQAYADASASFKSQRGRLPLPVESGFISRSFGMNPHPTISSIKIPNNGIDIRTDEYAQVFSVHDGEVVGVSFVPGHDYMVIIKHGKYFTVYTNLQEIRVRKGDSVFGRDLLGRVSMNPVSGVAELHFEVWLNKERLNPSLWLRR